MGFAKRVRTGDWSRGSGDKRGPAVGQGSSLGRKVAGGLGREKLRGSKGAAGEAVLIEGTRRGKHGDTHRDR